jgi:hypothetical protein
MLRGWARLDRCGKRVHDFSSIYFTRNPTSAKSRTVSAKETGLTREGLYKALSKDGNPSLGTVLKVLKALGLKFTPQVA